MTAINSYEASEFTREQGNKTSCIDYFLSKGMEVQSLKVGEKFGKSDHRLITCTIEKVSPIVRRQNLVFSKTRARLFLQRLIDSGIDQAETNTLKFFRALSAKLKRYALVNMSTPRNFFKVIPKVESELNSPTPNWPQIRKLILSCRNTEFLAV